jgi:ethanolamine utilization protein EutN
MYLAKVIGQVEASVRLPGFAPQKLLVLQPVNPRLEPIRWSVIALDITGAGLDTLVVYEEGREAANPFSDPPLPVDAVVVAIVDSLDYDAEAGFTTAV